MSGEQILDDNSIKTQSERNKYKINSKVDINILLNKVRKEQKKEKFENLIFISLISFIILATGVIISF